MRKEELAEAWIWNINTNKYVFIKITTINIQCDIYLNRLPTEFFNYFLKTHNKFILALETHIKDF